MKYSCNVSIVLQDDSNEKGAYPEATVRTLLARALDRSNLADGLPGKVHVKSVGVMVVNLEPESDAEIQNRIAGAKGSQTEIFAKVKGKVGKQASASAFHSR